MRARLLLLQLPAASLVLLFHAAAQADPLHGKVERSSNARVSRPSMPSRPMGDALDQVSQRGGHHKAGFNLAATSVSNLLDKNAFDLNYLQGSPRPDFSKASETKKAAAGEEDKELLIAWEEWHKNLCSNIYRFWQIYGTVPGNGSVTLNISKDGDVDFDLRDFQINHFEQFSPNQRDLFERSVNQTLHMIAHSEFLAFPARSKREKVTLSTRFSFTEADDGPSGYTWKKGDYEKVTAPR
ncbi:MAG: hypothetical protein K2X27_06505 [Candidatus Obscuribacterales bacterium]|nr:hypothetical protein [Candidatus Obscuribacterales bacterium]